MQPLIWFGFGRKWVWLSEKVHFGGTKISHPVKKKGLFAKKPFLSVSSSFFFFLERKEIILSSTKFAPQAYRLIWEGTFCKRSWHMGQLSIVLLRSNRSLKIVLHSRSHNVAISMWVFVIKSFSCTLICKCF